MNELEKVLERLKKVSSEINSSIKLAQYDKYDDLSGLDINYDDAEQEFLREELQSIFSRLEVISQDIEYLAKPIRYEGNLYKNSIGKYELNKDFQFSCGSSIEAYIYDEYDEKYKWVASRIEHNGKDYYLYGAKNISLDGLKARKR